VSSHWDGYHRTVHVEVDDDTWILSAVSCAKDAREVALEEAAKRGVAIKITGTHLETIGGNRPDKNHPARNWVVVAEVRS
jgi:hypothetical protein